MSGLRCCPGAGTMAHVRGCVNHPERPAILAEEPTLPHWSDRAGFEIRRRCDGCVNAAFKAGTTARPLRADFHDVDCPTLADEATHRTRAHTAADEFAAEFGHAHPWVAKIRALGDA